MIKMKHTKTYSILTGLASILLFCSGSFAAAQNIISQEDLEYRPATSVATALDGLDASLVTRLSSGNPSAEAIATLRGIISIVGNTPLVLVDGVEGTDELAKEIQDYVKHHTAPYKYPRIVVFRDELPKTISGKIQRALL